MLFITTVSSILPTLEVFARAGGGGSSGGGSSSGGSSGGGSGVGGIAAIGYLPTHFVSDWCTRNYSRAVGFAVGGAIGLLVTALMAILLGGYAPFDVFLIAVGAMVGLWTGSLNIIGKIRAASAANKKAIVAAASKDPVWQENTLQQRIQQVFTDYQTDWSNFNAAHMQTYLAPGYFGHASLMLAAMKVMNRQNIVASPKLIKTYITDINDDPDDSKDSFTAVVVAQADDQLIDTSTNATIYTDKSIFTEYWRFVRSGSSWLLAGIDQATANIFDTHQPLKQFAQDNGMFYSLDWGWLLLPQRGQLFSKANFKTSDINNHVIGQWNGIIVQMYTYRPSKEANLNYQIAQIALPKSYGGILIKRRGLINITPRGYQKVMFEWPDFNNRYAVYATDMDRVTSFELLNPKFMADLYDKDIKVEIEVVDNVVYLYSKVSLNETRYDGMMDILKAAFRELKL